MFEATRDEPIDFENCTIVQLNVVEWNNQR